jgi:caa(3)-type oxidase subunit IV
VIKALRPHLLPFLGLIGLLFVTAGCAKVQLGWFSPLLALAISCVQGLVIAIFFMELRTTSNLIRLTAFVGILWLAILLMLAMADYLTRFAL